MQAYHIESFKDIHGIISREHDMPSPGANEVLVRVKAVSLNRRDIAILHQIYALPGKPGVVPVSDGAGEVVSTGTSVTRFKTGDRVAANYFPHWRDGQMNIDIIDQLGCTVDGMLAEYVLLPEAALVRIPAYLTFEEAATLPCAALTAWSCLNEPRPISPGSTVLCFGSGGLSLFYIAFAKLFGARVIALTTRKESFAPLQAAGADHVLQYDPQGNWSADVLTLTGGRGVDRVVESNGADTFEQSLQALAVGGHLNLLNFRRVRTGAEEPPLERLLQPLFAKMITVQPLFVGSRLAFESMNRALEQHRLHPVIDKIFSFENVHNAYAYFESGKHVGKIVITLP